MPIESRGNDVAEEILCIADKQKVDTIVVGSRGIKSFQRISYGKCFIQGYSLCKVPRSNSKISNNF